MGDVDVRDDLSWAGSTELEAVFRSPKAWPCNEAFALSAAEDPTFETILFVCGETLGEFISGVLSQGQCISGPIPVELVLLSASISSTLLDPFCSTPSSTRKDFFPLQIRVIRIRGAQT